MVRSKTCFSILAEHRAENHPFAIRIVSLRADSWILTHLVIQQLIPQHIERLTLFILGLPVKRVLRVIFGSRIAHKRIILVVTNYDFIIVVIAVITTREIVVHIRHALITHLVLVRVDAHLWLWHFHHALAPGIVLLCLRPFILLLRYVLHNLLPTHAHFMILIVRWLLETRWP